MPSRTQRLRSDADGLGAALRAIRVELDVPDAFDPAVEQQAAAAAAAVTLPDEDRTDVAFVTIDPEGATDLDQALHIAREDGSLVVHYAIADVPAFVEPGGAVDDEARRRGQTIYAPDARVPLHPPVLSEDAASLLADQERPAFVWRFALADDGSVAETTLVRARVRSREQLSYDEAQRRIDAGDDMLGLLREVGELRIALEQQRGGASLDMPEEEIVADGDGWRIERRELLPVEQWNAQISLMTGMEAARLMLDAGVGILRTMPRPSDAAMRDFQRASTAIGVPWHDGEAYGAYLRRLDRTRPETLAILAEARRLFRGAGYTVLAGETDADDVVQAAIAAPYAHTTAPLRRLVDRYVLAICERLAAGEAPPAWAVDGLEGLPEIMATTGRIASQVERESVNVVEIAVLAPRVGDVFDAVVVERRDEESATVQVVDPPTEAACATRAEPGERIRARLTDADLDERLLRFAETAS